MADPVGFRRDIGLFLAVMIGIGAMMGPGIFALPGVVAGMIGPLGILVYLAMGGLTVFTALNYSELGAALPIAGGGYSFTSRTLPRPLAFLTGWFFWIGNTLACAMYAVVFALTVRAYFLPGLSMALIAIAVAAVFTLLNIRSMSEAIKVITVMNLIELAVLVGIALLGAFEVEAPNLTPVAPMGWTPFLPAMALIYISYVGFELITVASEEIIDPSKTIPRAILITLAVATIIYVFVVWVMMGAIPYEELAESDVPFIYAADTLFGGWGRWAGIIATVMASLSAFSVTLGAAARVLYALGRDGHLPYSLATLHRSYRTPHIALLVCAAVVVVFASSGIVEFVASMSDFGYLMGLGLVNLAVIALQSRMPNLRRPFQVALYPAVPIVGALSCWIFVPALETRSFVLGGLMTAAGATVYLSKARNRDQLFDVRDRLARKLYLLKYRKKTHMHVLIIGGGNKGQSIARRLLAEDEVRLMFRSAEHKVTFVEQDEAVCRQLEQTFHMPVYQGDGTKRELLQQVGPENIDLAIAAADDDGTNMIIALQAKRVGIAQVMALVIDPDHVPLLHENGVVAISAPWATAAAVENYLDRPGVADLFEIGAGVANLVGGLVPADARVIGQRISEASVPQECVVAAIIRGEKLVVPRGDTVIEEGDHVIFVGGATAIRKALDSFMVKERG